MLFVFLCVVFVFVFALYLHCLFHLLLLACSPCLIVPGRSLEREQAAASTIQPSSHHFLMISTGVIISIIIVMSREQYMTGTVLLQLLPSNKRRRDALTDTKVWLSNHHQHHCWRNYCDKKTIHNFKKIKKRQYNDISATKAWL